MGWQAWLTATAVLAMLAAMASNRVRPELALGATVAALLLAGVLTPARALAGLANEAVIGVGLLFVVAGAVRRSGALAPVVALTLGQVRRPGAAVARLMVPVALASGVLNNTPLVAMLLPEVRSWARRHGMAPSQLLLPLSYAAILGGTLTVIGTSTNLLVNGMLVDAGLTPIAFAEVGRVGLPLTVAGIALFIVAGRWLLPARGDSEAAFADPRAFTTEVEVEPGGPFDGACLDAARLADGTALLPVEIDRGGHVISAPRREDVLSGGDRLVIAGGPTVVAAALRTHGLRKVVDSAFDVRSLGAQRRLFELVVSERCPLVGEVVGTGSFRGRYGAAVLAIARHGSRVERSGGEGWTLQAGDTLLVEAGAAFDQTWRFHPHFHVVLGSEAQGALPGWHAVLALACLLGIVAATALGWLPLLSAALVAVLALRLGGLASDDALRESVDLRVLLGIAASLGVGAAIADTGLAAHVASSLVAVCDTPHAALAAVVLATMIITELVTNNAAAVLMLPMALETAARLHVAPTPFVLAVMVAASASFVTPMGYQTNLMVYGPGGYRFTDFVRAGVPMSALVFALTVWLVPLLWPWQAP